MSVILRRNFAAVLSLFLLVASLTLAFLTPTTWARSLFVPSERGSLDAATISCGGAPVDCGEGGGSFVVTEHREKLFFRNTCDEGSHYRRFGLGQAYGKLSRPIQRMVHYYGLEGTVFVKDDMLPQRLFLPKGPSWSYSAIWNLDESAIMASDTLTKSIFHFSLDSGLVRQVFTSSMATQKEFAPSDMQRVDGGYIIENSDGNLVRLDSGYAVQGQSSLLDVMDSHSFISKSITSWIESGGGDFRLWRQEEKRA